MVNSSCIKMLTLVSILFSRSSGMAELEEEDPFTLRAYIQTLTRVSKPHFEEKGSKIEDWVRQRTDVDHKTQF